MIDLQTRDPVDADAFRTECSSPTPYNAQSDHFFHICLVEVLRGNRDLVNSEIPDDTVNVQVLAVPVCIKVTV